MSKKQIAFTGKATGLPAYRYGADMAVDALERVRAQAQAGEPVSPYWLAEALNGLPPDSRRGFLVVLACYLAAASVVADDHATCSKVADLMAAQDDEGGAA